jgi:hypothetical protein
MAGMALTTMVRSYEAGMSGLSFDARPNVLLTKAVKNPARYNDTMFE